MSIIKNNKNYGTKVILLGEPPVPPVPPTPTDDYFYVEDVSGQDNTLSIIRQGNSPMAIEVFASTDQTNWVSMGTTNIDTPLTATVPANSKLYLKANTTKWGHNWDAGTVINTSYDFNVGGNIMSLLNGDDFVNSGFASNSSHNFDSLFRDCYTLINASELVLPATTLTDSCYRRMFIYCNQLIATPVLPATTLAEDCYSEMFNGCASLATAPVLPATTLTPSCYASMFANTALTTAPALPATTLASNCYFQLFRGCTSLTQAPVLPATTLADSCYDNMFRGCTSLTQAPALPATTLANRCYVSMFQGCSSLTQAPALPATTLVNQCYYVMFAGCTSLTAAPTLPATTLATNCYGQMFAGCSSLTTAPALPATTLVEYCYTEMFVACSSLNSVTTYAQDISAANCLTAWLYNVAATGDFYNLGGATYRSGDSGIPTGWTVHTSL